ncbi:phage major capsid protein [Clostridium paraputrificum]|uniref:phage major capsid protein n=1 Tax=Clostridium TaxID=1485 RepID=UPI000C06EB43|nr:MULTISPECIES: phage major capsid protein [Clostridium]MDB2089361.1 phage major capsid protein [Clostridium paraputrificum]MDB2097720.1 phage major capsid protein [Clostridium paraputrificum]MDU1180032.1 phage major capsid protein [Clostridium sp.]MDU1228087.1 phage major capsid protein [Clostridium sp.]MDU7654027.1 phage major capsid protein [Clostridium sp.]
MKIEERRQQIQDLTKELRGLVEEEKVDEAKAKKEELRKAKELLALEEEQEEEEMRDLLNQKRNGKDDENMEKREINKDLEYRALVKAMLGEKLNEEEQRQITDGNFNSNTSSIIPSEFINKVQVIRDGYKSLKNYCDVIPVTSDNGKMPVTSLDAELADLEEDTDMVETMLAVPEVDFKVGDKGLLKKVGNNILKDSPVNFIDGILAQEFAVASINKENKEICKVVGSNSKAVTVGAEAKVEDVLAKTISKELPTVRNGLVVITNPEGYAYLDNLKDANGRKSDDISYGADGTLYFKHKEVIEMADKTLPALTSQKTMVFYVVNLKTVPFFDRQQVEIAKSTEAGFVANKTLIRAIERFDVKANPNEKIKPKKIES